MTEARMEYYLKPTTDTYLRWSVKKAKTHPDMAPQQLGEQARFLKKPDAEWFIEHCIEWDEQADSDDVDLEDKVMQAAVATVEEDHTDEIRERDERIDKLEEQLHVVAEERDNYIEMYRNEQRRVTTMTNELDRQRQQHNERLTGEGDRVARLNRHIRSLKTYVNTLQEQVKVKDRRIVMLRQEHRLQQPPSPVDVLHEHQTLHHEGAPGFAAFTHRHLNGDKTHAHGSRWAGTIDDD